MRILIQKSEGGSTSVRLGWHRAFQSVGIQTRWWVPEAQSSHDAFHDFEPDCFLGTSYDVDDALEKCIRKRPHLRVGLFGSAWGPLADALPRDEFPIVRVSDGEKRRLSRLKEETGQPRFVFLHAHDEYLEGAMGGWREIGIEPVGVLNAADVFLYRPGKFRPDLACDAAMCGGYWGYKSRKLSPYVLPLTESDLDVKLFGYSPWPTPAYLGRLGEMAEPDLFASATVCMNVSEPHSTDPRYGSDIIERVPKTLACGGFLVTDHVPELDQVYPDGCMVKADSPSSFQDAVRHYARHPEERESFMKKGKEAVLAGHTYHHRAEALLRALGCDEEADRCLPALKELLG